MDSIIKVKSLLHYFTEKVMQFSSDYLEQAYSDLDYIGGEGETLLKKWEIL